MRLPSGSIDAARRQPTKRGFFKSAGLKSGSDDNGNQSHG
jgi:hypothetical protein